MLQIGAASLLQIGASIVTNWYSYYKLGQPLLQNRAAITNWGKMYYKLGQALQIRAIITNWGIALAIFHLHCLGHRVKYGNPEVGNTTQQISSTTQPCCSIEFIESFLF